MMKDGANMGIGAKVAVSTAIGGTAEVLGGGKFTNGAVTGAYVMMFNHLAQHGGGNEPPGKGANSSGSRPDEDGLLTHGEADGWYKWGKGDPLYVDLDKLDFSTVNMSRFDNPEFFIEGHPGVYVRFETSDYVNRNQALVYGTIGIVKIGDNTIMAMPDIYNFDLKLQNGTFMRDAATVLGQSYAGWELHFPYILGAQLQYHNTMKYLKFIILIILLGCNTPKDNSYYSGKLEKILNIDISDDFVLIEHNSDFAIGDYNERFKIKLSENNFEIALNSIDSSELKKINNMNLYYFNANNAKGDFISIILNPAEYTIQYSFNSE